ncbi:flagellar basal body L-ring protein FlgH [Sandarakinorhabdus rubra]|uniref:hypothetical protein n=1 Tax=Sandarakinorhabdus rubra TaxID=2672568 RepID=UPI0013DBD582|nr:hypothetical protein [Sandarakinorhabdus rubra]
MTSIPDQRQADDQDREEAEQEEQSEAALAYLRQHLELELTYADGTPVIVHKEDANLQFHIDPKTLCAALVAVWMQGEPTASNKAFDAIGPGRPGHDADDHQTCITITPKAIRFTCTAASVSCETEIIFAEPLRHVPDDGVAFLIPQSAFKKFFTQPKLISKENKTTKRTEKKWIGKPWQPTSYKSITYEEGESLLCLEDTKGGIFRFTVRKVVAPAPLRVGDGAVPTDGLSCQALASAFNYLGFMFVSSPAAVQPSDASLAGGEMVLNGQSKGLICQNAALKPFEFEMALSTAKRARPLLRRLAGNCSMSTGDEKLVLVDRVFRLSVPIKTLKVPPVHFKQVRKALDGGSWAINNHDFDLFWAGVYIVTSPDTPVSLSLKEKDGEYALIADGVSAAGKFVSEMNLRPECDNKVPELAVDSRLSAEDVVKLGRHKKYDGLSISFDKKFVVFSEAKDDERCYFVLSLRI